MIDTLNLAQTWPGQIVGGRPSPEAPAWTSQGRIAGGLALPNLPPRVELLCERSLGGNHGSSESDAGID